MSSIEDIERRITPALADLTQPKDLADQPPQPLQ